MVNFVKIITYIGEFNMKVRCKLRTPLIRLDSSISTEILTSKVEFNIILMLSSAKAAKSTCNARVRFHPYTNCC